VARAALAEKFLTDEKSGKDPNDSLYFLGQELPLCDEDRRAGAHRALGESSAKKDSPGDATGAPTLNKSS